MQLDSSLLFSFRTGKAGLGDDHVAVYTGSPDGGYAYEVLGTNLQGVQNNPYIHGLDYRCGILHATWVYRGFVHYEGWDDPLDTKHKQQRGPNSAENNHDICYAYSDDGGRGWRNGTGELIADLGRGESVRPDSKGVVAFEIPKGSGLSNQESQAVDHEGGVHVLNRDNTDGEQAWKHYYRSPDGECLRPAFKCVDTYDGKSGIWTQRALPYVQGVKGGKRGRLAVSKEGDLYLILPDNTAPTLTILKASKAIGYSEYELVWRQEGFPSTEPLVDTTRLDYDNVLSVFTRSGSAANVDVVVLDFEL